MGSSRTQLRSTVVRPFWLRRLETPLMTRLGRQAWDLSPGIRGEGGDVEPTRKAGLLTRPRVRLHGATNPQTPRQAKSLQLSMVYLMTPRRTFGIRRNFGVEIEAFWVVGAGRGGTASDPGSGSWEC